LSKERKKEPRKQRSRKSLGSSERNDNLSLYGISFEDFLKSMIETPHGISEIEAVSPTKEQNKKK